jgi:hypothetical protein
VIAWRSSGSSRRRGKPFTWRSAAVIAKVMEVSGEG